MLHMKVKETRLSISVGAFSSVCALWVPFSGIGLTITIISPTRKFSATETFKRRSYMSMCESYFENQLALLTEALVDVVGVDRADSLAVLFLLLTTTTGITHGYKQQVLRPGDLRRYRHQRHHDVSGVLQDARGEQKTTTICRICAKIYAPAPT